MKTQKWMKETFVVIGKEGTTYDGEGFIQKLWQEANLHFHEVAHLARLDKHGEILGIWGAMSDFSHSFKPWENGFSQGVYLAGVECNDNSEPPKGWAKWVIPGYEYIYTQNDGKDTFTNMIKYLKENNIPLVGAVQDFSCPKTGENYMLFPIRRL